MTVDSESFSYLCTFIIFREKLISWKYMSWKYTLKKLLIKWSIYLAYYFKICFSLYIFWGSISAKKKFTPLVSIPNSLFHYYSKLTDFCKYIIYVLISYYMLYCRPLMSGTSSILKGEYPTKFRDNRVFRNRLFRNRVEDVVLEHLEYLVLEYLETTVVFRIVGSRIHCGFKIQNYNVEPVSNPSIPHCLHL